MKKNMRFVIVLLILVAFVVPQLFAAGTSEVKQKTKEINVWYWDQNADEIYKEMAQEYEAAHPGISIKLTVIPWADYWTKLQIALPTGTGPDIFWLNHPNAVSYLPTGLVMNLEDQTAKINFDNFNEIYYKPYMYNNDRYGVPIFFDSVILYYNKAMFDKAGLAYPDDTWTWDDYLAASRKLTIKDGKKTIQYGTIVDPNMQSGISNFILQNGGKLYSEDRNELQIDNPETKESIQYNLDMIYKYGCAPTISEMREIGKSTMFQSGMSAMVTYHTGILRQFAEVLGDDMGIAPLPKNKQRASIYHNIGYVASAKTEHPTEVVEFLSFLASERHAEILSKVWAPCYTGGAELFFEEFSSLDVKYIIDTVHYGYPLPIAAKNAGPAYTMLNKEMDKILMNPTVGDSLAPMQKIINAEINK